MDEKKMTLPTEMKTVPQGKNPTFYIDMFNDLQDSANPFDIRLGNIRWKQGCVLNELRKSCKKRGSWGDALKAIGIKSSTAQLLRKIATVVPASRASSMSYDEMRVVAYPSFAKSLEVQLDKDAESDNSTTPKNRIPNGNSSKETHLVKLVRDLNCLQGKVNELASKELLPHPKSPQDADEQFGLALTSIRSIEGDVARIRSMIEGRVADLRGIGRAA